MAREAKKHIGRKGYSGPEGFNLTASEWQTDAGEIFAPQTVFPLPG